MKMKIRESDARISFGAVPRDDDDDDVKA